MRGTVTAAALAAALLGSVLSEAARAQSFEQMQQKVKIGAKVEVVDTGGRTTKGVLREITASQIVLSAGGPDPIRRFTADGVVRVERLDSVLDGMLIGVAAAVGGGILVSKSLDTCIQCEEFGYVSLALVGGGAGIGALIDAAIGPKVVFEAPERGPSFVLAPVLSRRATGLMVTMRF